MSYPIMCVCAGAVSNTATAASLANNATTHLNAHTIPFNLQTSAKQPPPPPQHPTPTVVARRRCRGIGQVGARGPPVLQPPHPIAVQEGCLVAAALQARKPLWRATGRVRDGGLPAGVREPGRVAKAAARDAGIQVIPVVGAHSLQRGCGKDRGHVRCVHTAGRR